jgi:hypothetical protein
MLPRLVASSLTTNPGITLLSRQTASFKIPSVTPRNGSTGIVHFAESIYLPWVESEKRPATYNGYKL